MTQIIRVSKQGKNVLTETDPNSFIFDSNLNTFKILASGTTSASITSDGQEITVAHNQSSRPTVFAFAKFPDNYVALPRQSDHALTNGGDRYWFAEVDNTNMYFRFYVGTSGNYTVYVSYYVFEAPV